MLRDDVMKLEYKDLECRFQCFYRRMGAMCVEEFEENLQPMLCKVGTLRDRQEMVNSQEILLKPLPKSHHFCYLYMLI
jgi:hypothetical protein